jgi:hypothetical protein
MNAPEPRRRLARKGKRRRLAERHRKAHLAEVRRQCRLANAADKRDNWEQFVWLGLQ